MLGIIITNPEKIVFQNPRITKLDLVNYYREVAPLMLKSISKRPITLFRCHGGICGECFFKKHPNSESEFTTTFLCGEDEYFFLQTARQIVFEVQLGTIEFHTWGSKFPNVDTPDLMEFDLDPAEDVPLSKLRQGAKNLKAVLDELGLISTLKTSGGKGYHILVPFKKRKSWEEFSEISRQISLLAESKFPDFFTTNIRKDKRTGKIFIDFLRNKKGASLVAPFSVRAREGAPISMPISWDLIDKIKPNEINILNYKKYLPKN